MPTVVRLPVRSQAQTVSERQAALTACFALHRRADGDVFWLKENAELLNVLETTGAALDHDALAAYRPFYDQIEKRLEFFPQYYRFLLSLCLDLEDLGMEGGKGEALVNWIASEGMAEAELSDLQRSEARRLMMRRGRDPLPADLGLDDRMRTFAARSATFAMPNRKAAYELTHIVFYLSEYGRRDPALAEGTEDSLDFAGTLAFLEQDADLLAEVCIAMRFAGLTPPEIWEDWLTRETFRFTVETGRSSAAADNYHEFLICNWLMAVAGRDAFAKRFASGRMRFLRGRERSGVLRELSEQMFGLDQRRSGDWRRMRPVVEARLADTSRALLAQAEAASRSFEHFFARFARVGLREARP
ncbi:MAG: hypothetical protein R3E44_13860 [Paracoccaceae bacterium]